MIKSPLSFSLYDNTLRDGEQTVGVSFSTKEKVHIASLLCDAGFKAFEAGFAGSSLYDLKSIKAVVNAVRDSKIYSLARLNKNDINAAKETGVHGITLFAPASDVLIQARGYKEESCLFDDIMTYTSYAKSLNLHIRFSCEDAARAPISRVTKMYRTAQKKGAAFISFADTTGIAVPDSMHSTVKKIIKAIPLPLSIHCHNDLGLSVANSIAAVNAGASEIQVTLNGLGERAGNTPAEEFILAMKVGYGVDLGIDLAILMKLSHYISKITGLTPAYNKPIIGKNVFRHESGIHVQALLDPKLHAYEPFPPEWVGRKHEIAFGKHSGKSNIRYLCREYGIMLDESKEIIVVDRLKKIARTLKRSLEKHEILELIYSIHK